MNRRSWLRSTIGGLLGMVAAPFIPRRLVPPDVGMPDTILGKQVSAATAWNPTIGVAELTAHSFNGKRYVTAEILEDESVIGDIIKSDLEAEIASNFSDVKLPSGSKIRVPFRLNGAIGEMLWPHNVDQHDGNIGRA